MNDRVDRAFEILKGYCTKKTNCNGCRFEDQKLSGRCILTRDIPADWKKPEKEDK